MTDKLKTCHETKTGNIITPQGRLSYAQYLVNGQTNPKTGKFTHNLSLVLPPESDLKLLKKKMAEIGMDKFKGDKNRVKKFIEQRFLNPNDLPNGGKPLGEQFEGWTLIRATNKMKPDFVHPSGQKVLDSEVEKEAYSGRWARVTLNVYAMNKGENPGIFLGLQNVQLLGHDENLGVAKPDGEDEFDSVGGVAEQSASTQPAESVDSLFE